MDTFPPIARRLGLTEAALVLDEERARANIARMAARARAAGALFRPHQKTHGSAAVAEWFRDEGVTALTTASLGSAAYFADSGWTDISVAFPLHPSWAPRADELAARVRLGVTVDHPAAVDALARSLGRPVRLWIKVDAGYGRAGVPWDRPDLLEALLARAAASPRLRPAGLLAHSGHTYAARSAAEVTRVHETALGRLRSLREAFLAAAEGPCLLSVGDTPAASLAPDLSGADELRPGNFVFYDLWQLALGSCRPEDLALALAAPVVGEGPGRRVLQAGAVHLSKERLVRPDGEESYGCLALPREGGWGAPDEERSLYALTQEHGLVRAGPGPDGGPAPGSVAAVLPVHACLAANLHAGYHLLDGRFLPRRRSGDRDGA